MSDGAFQVPNLLETLAGHCAMQPDKLALELLAADGDGQRVTYGRLEQNVQRAMAYLLGEGIAAGDRVALQLPKSLTFVYLHLAILRLGAISLPLNPGYPPRELVYFINDAEAGLFIADTAAREALTPHLTAMPALGACRFVDAAAADGFDRLVGSPDVAAAVARPIPPADDGTCLMIYTSGTTGRPKGAMLTRSNLSHNIDALHRAWGWRQDDVLLHVLPVFHAHGLLVALHGALNAGATCLMLPKFDPECTLDTLVNRRCTVFMAVPTIHQRLVEHPGAADFDLSHMRLLTSGSDRLPDDLFRAYQTTFGHTLLERYGMSETNMNLSNPLHGERRVGSVGMPLPYVEARIVDPATEAPLPDGEIGEVQIRGPHVCKGYWRQPEKTAEAFTADGWLRTGDMGLREPDGYYTLKGRSKDLIISGGYNVYPPEVELVLADHPAIKASAVIGCPSAEWGEVVTGVVILRAGHEASAEALTDYCRARLVGYKVPRRWVFVDAFPSNALGKVQKAMLRRQLCG